MMVVMVIDGDEDEAEHYWNMLMMMICQFC